MTTPSDGERVCREPRAERRVRAVNRLLAAGETVSADGSIAFYVSRGAATAERLQAARRRTGSDMSRRRCPGRRGLRLRDGRASGSGIATADRWKRAGRAGSSSSSSSRSHACSPSSSTPAICNAAFDVLVFVDGAIPAETAHRRRRIHRTCPPSSEPHLGRITVERTVAQLRAFVEAGGTIVAIGSSAANLARHFSCRLTNHLVENGTPLAATEVLRAGLGARREIDTSASADCRDAGPPDVFFDNSPVFALPAPPTRRFGRLPRSTARRRSAADGRGVSSILSGGVGVLEAQRRQGPRRALRSGDPLQRAQPHGTFKLLFNALYTSTVR